MQCQEGSVVKKKAEFFKDWRPRFVRIVLVEPGPAKALPFSAAGGIRPLSGPPFGGSGVAPAASVPASFYQLHYWTEPGEAAAGSPPKGAFTLNLRTTIRAIVTPATPITSPASPKSAGGSELFEFIVSGDEKTWRLAVEHEHDRASWLAGISQAMLL